MTPEELRDVVVSCLRSVAPESDPATLPPDADLRDELDLDSMDFLKFVTKLHAELGVELNEPDYPKLRTLAGSVALLESRLRDSPGRAPSRGA